MQTGAMYVVQYQMGPGFTWKDSAEFSTEAEARAHRKELETALTVSTPRSTIRLTGSYRILYRTEEVLYD